MGRCKHEWTTDKKEYGGSRGIESGDADCLKYPEKCAKCGLRTWQLFFFTGDRETENKEDEKRL